MDKEQSDFDIAIIGGGPAGATTAAYLARAGLTCVVLEKEHFPRPHVGESLVTSTTRIFKELGFLEQMERAGFPHKYGAAWTSDSGFASDVTFEDYDYSFGRSGVPRDVDVRFEERKQEGIEQDYTYHVDRAKFDHLLLEHAAKLGAQVLEGARVYDVCFSEPKFVTVRFRKNEQEGKIRVRMVVDASGRRTFFGNKLALRNKDPHFDQYALHTWFEDYDRGESEKRDYIFIHFLSVSNTWVWQIPITESITSIGVVTQKSNFLAAKGSYDEFFWQCLRTRPELYRKLQEAKQLRPLKPEGDYSYAMERFCGDRFVLVGDAARFVDPIFSSGVSIAMHSARLASQYIIKASHKGTFGRENFEEFETIMRRGCNNWYEFISLYYRLNVLFTYFVGNPRYRLDVLRLLQGDVYDDEEPEVLVKMRQIVREVEEDEEHPWHGLLGDLTSNRPQRESAAL